MHRKCSDDCDPWTVTDTTDLATLGLLLFSSQIEAQYLCRSPGCTWFSKKLMLKINHIFIINMWHNTLCIAFFNNVISCRPQADDSLKSYHWKSIIVHYRNSQTFPGFSQTVIVSTWTNSVSCWTDIVLTCTDIVSTCNTVTSRYSWKCTRRDRICPSWDNICPGRDRICRNQWLWR